MSDPWGRIQTLVGRWRKSEEGAPGSGTGEREYRFVLGDSFLEERNRSVFAPQPANPRGEIHEDWGLFSFDKGRGRLVLRQFHSEGFVNQYVLEEDADGARTLRFVSEAIENGPPGMRARRTIEMPNDDEVVDAFEIAMPGKDFQRILVNRLRREK